MCGHHVLYYLSLTFDVSVQFVVKTLKWKSDPDVVLDMWLFIYVVYG